MNTHTEEFSKDIEYYDRILEIDPNNVSAWYNKGGALYSLEKNEEAIDCIDKALEIKPDLAEAWYNRGSIFYFLGYVQKLEVTSDITRVSVYLHSDVTKPKNICNYIEM